MGNDDNIGQRIIELRKSRNMTLKQMGAILGIAESSITVWEKNNHDPSLRMIKLICEKFRVSSDSLIFGRETNFGCNTCGTINSDMTGCGNLSCSYIENNLKEKLKASEEHIKMNDKLLKSAEKQILLLEELNNILKEKR
jgi:transcriptional regulator with XRE-family HTH domain